MLEDDSKSETIKGIQYLRLPFKSNNKLTISLRIKLNCRQMSLKKVKLELVVRRDLLLTSAKNRFKLLPKRILFYKYRVSLNTYVPLADLKWF